MTAKMSRVGRPALTDKTERLIAGAEDYQPNSPGERLQVMTIRVPASMHEDMAFVAKNTPIGSMNQLVLAAIADKLAELKPRALEIAKMMAKDDR